jgi:N utilization substance protein B
MGTRRKGRELALQALYQMEMTRDLSVQSLELFLRHFEGNPDAKEFARRLATGVLEHRKEVDRLIRECAEHWKLSRMAKVDLTILRLATYEMLFCADIPMQVSMDEAIEIGKRYGSGDSATFINGVLDHVAQAGGVKE